MLLVGAGCSSYAPSNTQSAPVPVEIQPSAQAGATVEANVNAKEADVEKMFDDSMKEANANEPQPSDSL